MRDRRRVDELSIEELEQVLAMRKREERQKRLARMKRSGRVVEQKPTPAPAKPPLTLDELVSHIAENPSTPGLSPAFVEDSPPPSAPASVPPPAPMGPGKDPARMSRRTLNMLLYLVEAAAVIGLVALGWQLTQGITFLEEQSAEAQAAAEEARSRTVPTIAPTPFVTLNDVVLPGGHKFVEGQTPTLNVDEIPANIRLAVADQITRPVINRPPATDETALRLAIPKLGIEQTIVQGSDWDALKQGVGQVLNGYDPGDDDGTVALAAHNDIYGELFRDLDQLAPGDQFEIQTRTGSHLYQITRTEIVQPTDVHVLQSTGEPIAVLISCYPYRVNTQRIVVFANRLS